MISLKCGGGRCETGAYFAPPPPRLLGESWLSVDSTRQAIGHQGGWEEEVGVALSVEKDGGPGSETWVMTLPRRHLLFIEIFCLGLFWFLSIYLSIYLNVLQFLSKPVPISLSLSVWFYSYLSIYLSIYVSESIPLIPFLSFFLSEWPFSFTDFICSSCYLLASKGSCNSLSLSVGRPASLPI